MALHATIDSIGGYLGKPAVAFSPHGSRPGQTDETSKKWIAGHVMITVVVTNNPQNTNNNEKETKELVAPVSALMNG
jgi:hypothetical protein